MPKVNWSIVTAGLIAGLALMLIQEFAFKRKLNTATGEITSTPLGL
jgi:hypothetical protein